MNSSDDKSSVVQVGYSPSLRADTRMERRPALGRHGLPVRLLDPSTRRGGGEEERRRRRRRRRKEEEEEKEKEEKQGELEESIIMHSNKTHQCKTQYSGCS